MKTKLTHVLGAAIALFVPVASALAASRTDAPVLELKTNWLAIAYALAAALLVCFAGFKKTGRTHLD